MTYFEAAFERIKTITSTRTQVELADVLGIRQSSISDAKRRGSIPSDWFLTLMEKYWASPRYIKTGEGPKFLGESDTPGGAPIEYVAPKPVTADCFPLEDLLAALKPKLDALGFQFALGPKREEAPCPSPVTQ